MKLSEEEKGALRNFRYNGGDLSLVYKYLLSPFAEFCVDGFIPEWLAPNVITFVALIISLVATAITIVVNPTLSAYSSPRWLGLLNAVSIFAYQTLDNMDGKQARKTKSSSALGMFFDHGCDAINASVTILAVGAIIGSGWTGRLYSSYLTWVPFYFQTWEEYYSGARFLPFINGPSEGLLLTVITCLFSYFFGSEIFHVELFKLPSQVLLHENVFLQETGYPTIENPGVTMWTLMLYFLTLCSVSTIIVHTYRVILARVEQNLDILQPLLNLGPFVIMSGCGFYYVIESPIGFKTYPIVTALFLCAMFAEVNIHIMVCHMCSRRLDFIHQYSLWFLVILTAVVMSGNPILLKYESALLALSTIISVISLVTEFYLICVGFAESLDIHIFQLGKIKIE